MCVKVGVRESTGHAIVQDVSRCGDVVSLPGQSIVGFVVHKCHWDRLSPSPFLLGCDAMYYCRRLPKFRRGLSHPFSGFNKSFIKFLRALSSPIEEIF
jgi:hypothetical protein